MCGIVGMVSSNKSGFTTTQKAIFNQLLWADTLRGEDSTGIFGVNKYGNIEYLKSVGTLTAMQDQQEFKDFQQNIYSDFQMVVGHNRKATRGTVTDENAHPFVEKNTILVHNGTLQNHAELTTQVVDVDSHAILHSIVERGHEETLKQIQGAFTLAWYSAEDKTLNLIRNEQRPLFIANSFGAWYFASEKLMLEWILDREHVTISDMTECVPGTLYSFKLEDEKNMWFKPMELYSFKKETKSTALTILPETTNKIDSGTYYNNTDFPIGTNILVTGITLQKLNKKNQKGFDHLYFGEWYQDPTVKVKCWATTAQVEFLEEEYDDVSKDVLFQTKIMCVMTKGNVVTLICENVSPYEPKLDHNGTEIMEDQYIFTDGKCSYCNKPTNFEELIGKGVFGFESTDDYVVQCEHCVLEGREKKV